MPYSTISDLPAQVRDLLSPDEQAQWLAVFNRVLEQTGDEEKALLAAWGAVRKARAAGRAMTLEHTVDGTVLVKGWGMKFTGVDDPDSYGTHFSTLTNLLAEYYQDAPLWYEHGLDLDYGYKPIGKRRVVEIYGFGVWAVHELFTDHPLYERTRREIEAGQLSYSSDSILHYVDQGTNMANGEIRMWPLAGWSLTKQPAEPGLGPVTLDGMQATIQDVVNSPARRMPVEDGRVIVTLTSCKSVYDPQRDPTVAAVSSPDDDSQAREAHESGGQQSSDSHISEGTIMNPEALRALADFFGVDATPDAVRASMDTMIAALRGEDEHDVDAEALRMALSIDDDAGDEAVITELASLRAQLDADDEPDDSEADTDAPDVAPESDTDVPARSTYNYHALRTARSVLDTPPAGNPPMPHHVPRGGQRAARSRALHAPHVNMGVRAPAVEDAVLAALGVTPPNFRRATLPQARARLFQLDRAAKAGSDAGPQGAWVLHQEIAADILAPLVDRLVLFQAGAFRWPMGGIDSLTVRKQVGLPGAYWTAEDTAVEGDDVNWATAQLTLKELRAPTTWPNRWLRNVLPQVEGMLRDSIEKAMRLKLEYSALYGTGSRPADGKSTGMEPLGVRYTDGVTITDKAGAALDVDDLATAQGTLEDANVDESETWGWLSRPSLFRQFEYMKDANGHPIMRESWMDGVRAQSLVNYPYHKTNQVPLSGGQTDLFFGDWQELVVGMGQDVELVVSEHRYIDQNATFVMGVAYVDTAVMWSEAFHIHTNCG
jgi:HK97 family phage major capsid protein